MTRRTRIPIPRLTPITILCWTLFELSAAALSNENLGGDSLDEGVGTTSPTASIVWVLKLILSDANLDGDSLDEGEDGSSDPDGRGELPVNIAYRIF